MSITQSFIAGATHDSTAHYENINPSTGGVIGLVARGSKDDIDLAVEAARSAQSSWRAKTPRVRADLLDEYSRRILADVDQLSLIESEDTGKPISQARNDVQVCARYFQFYSRSLETFYGYEIPLGPEYQVTVSREPYGVIGHILAWNYPMQLFARAVGPAIATGNTVVVKPADETPRTAVRLAELAVLAGIPSGVVNVVTGTGEEAGAALTSHTEVDHLGFVGSTEVGRLVAHAAADNLKPAVLELGGKSPHIVFPDADLDIVTPTIVKTIIQNAGQTCSAGSRLIVSSSIRDELIDRVAREMEQVRIGPGLDDPDLGPLISPQQLSRVEGFLREASGEVVTGGGAPEVVGGGNYFSPTLVTDVDPYSRIAQEEIFGPVLVSMSFETISEAIEIANSTEYGLIAAVWTNDLNVAHRVSAGVIAGQVFVNNFGAGGGVELPFGGFKSSGYGREKGIEALYATTQTKTTIFKIDPHDG